jgi:multidrug efflux pump
MKFTDLFVHRPVIAISVSLIILLSGLWALCNLPLSLYPRVTVPVVEVSTIYPGASPEVVKNYVTTQLQSNFTGINGVDYITSTSSQGNSKIDLFFHLGENLDEAVATVMRKAQEVSGQLPNGVLAPSIYAGERYNNNYFILQATSPKISLEWVTDYLNRMIIPQLELMEGVSNVMLWGPNYTMDIDLNPEQLAAHNLSAQNIITALQNYNIPATPGSTYGEGVSYSLNPNTTLHSQSEFNNLVVKNAGEKSIYLKDVGTALFHSINESVHAYFNGIQGDAIAIAVNINSNPLIVAEKLYKTLPQLQKHMSGKISLGVIFDITKFISSSLHEVIKAIAESILVVVIVMLLLLGSPRTVMIPLSTIPLSLIGVCFIMWLCHFSFNTLTLLAMVLAIGLVVDDAIVVVENIVRHIENGESALNATLIGAREIAQPVIAMTLTLAAVYAPMLMASGITGHLFTEFAMTLAGSVLISGIIALTLSPLLCSRLLSQKTFESSWVIAAEQRVNYLCRQYTSKLEQMINPKNRNKSLLIWLGILLSCVIFYQSTPHELVPNEDTGILQLAAKAPADANLNYLERYRPDIEKILNKKSDIAGYIEVLQNNIMFGYISLKDWGKRHESSEKLLAALQSDFGKITGVSSFVSNISLLPGSDNSNSISIVLVGNVDYPALYTAAKKLEQLAQSTGHFLYLQDDLQFNQPQINFQIDPAAATSMNVTPNSIATQLSDLLSQGKIQQFAWEGRSYDVVISIPKQYRRNPEDIGNLQITNEQGKLIPINSIASMTTSIVPQTLNQFQKMSSVTISAMPTSSTSFSDALEILQKITDKNLDKNILLDYSGMTRQFMQEGHRTLWIFVMAVLIIFLVLSIQFNRFKDAFVILLGSVPLALFGALLPLWLGLGTINIFTQIGLLTLVGLISKHGILLTEFANKAQLEDKLTAIQAIIQAAKLRFRPILMTTAAMIVGALPLVFATGAGAESRHAIGIVIVFGMGIGTIFTLFVVPVLYLWFGRKSTNTTVVENAIKGYVNETGLL